jgi:hypothetical protein
VNVWVALKTECELIILPVLPFFSGFLFAYYRAFFIILHRPHFSENSFLAINLRLLKIGFE